MSTVALPRSASAEPSQTVSSPNYLREVLTHALRESPAWRVVFGSALAEAAAALVSPWVVSRVLDTAIPSSAVSTLGMLALAVVVSAGHSAFASWFHERVCVVLSHRLETKCLDQVLTQYLNTPYEHLQSAHYGDTNETLSSAGQAVVGLVRSFVRLVTLCFSGVAFWLMLAVYNLELAFFSSALVLVIGLLCASFSFKERRAVREVLSASSKNRELLHVLISAIPTLRASGATGRLIERWVGLVRTQTAHGIRRDYAQLNRAVVVQFGQQLATWVATAWLIQSTLDGTITLGALMTATLLVGSLVRVGIGVADTLLGAYALQPHWERVNQLLKQARQAPTREAIQRDNLGHLEEYGLRLDGVSFRYDVSERWVLQDYTLYFPALQHTTLRAASGQGKSTILRLLAGLVAPTSGQVSALGRDPRHCSGLVAYLPQQSMLLEASIATNLTTLSGTNIERALQVAEWTGLALMLQSLPMGGETWVSAGGSNLSAGQRQLLLLTAVFAGAAPVVLLDEATSQLDHESLARIDWPALCAGRTVVSVTH